MTDDKSPLEEDPVTIHPLAFMRIAYLCISIACSVFSGHLLLTNHGLTAHMLASR